MRKCTWLVMPALLCLMSIGTVGGQTIQTAIGTGTVPDQLKVYSLHDSVAYELLVPTAAKESGQGVNMNKTVDKMVLSSLSSAPGKGNVLEWYGRDGDSGKNANIIILSGTAKASSVPNIDSDFDKMIVQQGLNQINANYNRLAPWLNEMMKKKLSTSPFGEVLDPSISIESISPLKIETGNKGHYIATHFRFVMNLNGFTLPGYIYVASKPSGSNPSAIIMWAYDADYAYFEPMVRNFVKSLY